MSVLSVTQGLTLQSTFVRALARDYENWATSSNYREERRKFTQNSDGNFQ